FIKTVLEQSRSRLGPTLQRKEDEESTYTIILTFCFAPRKCISLEQGASSGTTSFQDKLEIHKMPVTFLQDHKQ
ncbi:hypothetical protein DV515_00009596, partial [Chloebia gouldiae]